jgi:predicted transcriptional regulator
MKETRLSKSTIYYYLRTFEAENPELAVQMKKRKDVTPEDYKKLQAENARLQSELKHERLRADFYEEMVKFGEEVYGIDLKKAGTK